MIDTPICHYLNPLWLTDNVFCSSIWFTLGHSITCQIYPNWANADLLTIGRHPNLNDYITVVFTETAGGNVACNMSAIMFKPLWVNTIPDSKVHRANMGPTWGPPGSCRPQMGPMLAPWTLQTGMDWWLISLHATTSHLSIWLDCPTTDQSLPVFRFRRRRPSWVDVGHTAAILPNECDKEKVMKYQTSRIFAIFIHLLGNFVIYKRSPE